VGFAQVSDADNCGFDLLSHKEFRVQVLNFGWYSVG
jgi:hypothetical protein